MAKPKKGVIPAALRKHTLKKGAPKTLALAKRGGRKSPSNGKG